MVTRVRLWVKAQAAMIRVKIIQTGAFDLQLRFEPTEDFSRFHLQMPATWLDLNAP